jgi:hypothetical protein
MHNIFKIYIFSFYLFYNIFTCYGQFNLEWYNAYDGNEHKGAEPTKMQIDNSNNIYVFGLLRKFSPNDITPYLDLGLVKYNPAGDTLWTREFGRQGP